MSWLLCSFIVILMVITIMASRRATKASMDSCKRIEYETNRIVKQRGKYQDILRYERKRDKELKKALISLMVARNLEQFKQYEEQYKQNDGGLQWQG